MLYWPIPRTPQDRRFIVIVLALLVAIVLILVVWRTFQPAPQTVLPPPVVNSSARNRTGSLHEVLSHPDLIPTHDHPLLGQPAPDVELVDLEGKVWSLKKSFGCAPVVLIFYYGFHCDHCVRQLYDVDGDLPLFHEVGARLVALSADPAESTQRGFRQYGALSFPVLSDPGNKVARAYRVLQADRPRHATFIIDRQGTIRWVNIGDAPFRRNTSLLCQLALLEGRLPAVPPIKSQ